MTPPLSPFEQSVEKLQFLHLCACADKAEEAGLCWLANGYRALAALGLWPVRAVHEEGEGWQWWKEKPDWLLSCRLSRWWYAAVKERYPEDKNRMVYFQTLAAALRGAAEAWADWQSRRQGPVAVLSRAEEELRARDEPVQSRFA